MTKESQRFNSEGTILINTVENTFGSRNTESVF